MHDRPELDPLDADRAVVGDGEDDLVGLIGDNRAVGQKQRVMLAAEQSQPPEEPRRQKAVLVLEDRAAADGAGLGVDDVVDKVHPPDVLVFGLVGEPNRDWIAASRDDCRAPAAASRR